MHLLPSARGFGSRRLYRCPCHPLGSPIFNVGTQGLLIDPHSFLVLLFPGSTSCGLFPLSFRGHELQLKMEECLGLCIRLSSVFRPELQLLSTHRADFLRDFGMHGLVEALGAEHMAFKTIVSEESRDLWRMLFRVSYWMTYHNA